MDLALKWRRITTKLLSQDARRARKTKIMTLHISGKWNKLIRKMLIRDAEMDKQSKPSKSPIRASYKYSENINRTLDNK